MAANGLKLSSVMANEIWPIENTKKMKWLMKMKKREGDNRS